MIIDDLQDVMTFVEFVDIGWNQMILDDTTWQHLTSCHITISTDIRLDDEDQSGTVPPFLLTCHKVGLKLAPNGGFLGLPK